ncbi:Glyceraldehyde-3-phosphate dehydrogenase [Metallosphaera sp. J1]|uniref:phosphorylating glyceraldehyde-3-phosphate dehydrogenase n=1 Tax=Metallosphaera TaxID=41980 RepID=UPI001EDD0A15|nr:phosphorylating glyceraldehyde-3-phosphate dehydrogenase [Metallosphaera javensis (ex Hofmann et al. 2022)]MCG3109507.1 Glyceraldehyde-3-phosphate dehydrogenase [Metallosphaera javensis (ex Hofmann et al. 2022)]BCS94160.1 MAG: glyceraldehyde-3-phosphate dehydrogenase [Metallosphaera javensis (ex Sakai et al. 2022)]
MIKVAVNGYGTIGKRVASAILAQPDMTLVGVSKTSPNYEAYQAQRMGINLYVTKESLKEFEEAGIKVKGVLEDMIREADVVVDATPNGVGAQYKQVYTSMGKRALFQGGEKANVADVSFSALCNYDEAVDKKYVRVVSCNTTGLLRTLCTLNRVSKITRVRGTIVRRGADPKEVKKGPINSLVPDPASIPSHHAKDVNTVLKDLDIVTMAVVAPTTLMHVHLLDVTVSSPVTREDVLSVISSTPRILLVSGKSKVSSTAEIVEVARDMGRPRNDLYELVVFEDSVSVKGNEIFLMYAVHQESIVVPENVDAIRAVSGFADGRKSIEMTNASMGIGKGYLV